MQSFQIISQSTNKERRICQNICSFLVTWNRTEVDSVTQNVRCTCKHYHCVTEHALKKFSLLCFDFCVKLRLCYDINDVTLRFF